MSETVARLDLFIQPGQLETWCEYRQSPNLDPYGPPLRRLTMTNDLAHEIASKLKPFARRFDESDTYGYCWFVIEIALEDIVIPDHVIWMPVKDSSES